MRNESELVDKPCSCTQAAKSTLQPTTFVDDPFKARRNFSFPFVKYLSVCYIWCLLFFVGNFLMTCPAQV